MASEVFSQDVVPVGTGYLILMTVLAAGLRLQRRDAAQDQLQTGQDQVQAGQRQPESGPGGKRPGVIARGFRSGWPRFAAQSLTVMIGGYLLLMAVDISYYYGIARVAGQFLASAFTGGIVLIGISVPVFAVASWAAEQRRRRGTAEDHRQD
jgi:hypothetical protein